MSDRRRANGGDSSPFDSLGFSVATRQWLAGSFAAPTPAQLGAWESIAEGRHTLVVAPTGSGKTLAAFLAAIDRLMRPDAGDANGVRVVYVSPLKALAVDVERNLRSPLVGISHAAIHRGEPFRETAVGIRTGDTTAAERRRLQSHPPDILITTPESLFLMLTSSVRETLRTTDTVIVDEIHAMAGGKRGAHLALSLERLDALLERPAQRIGLSATVRPHEEVARFLGGQAPVRVVAPESGARMELDIVVPVQDMTRLGPRRSAEIREGSAAQTITVPSDETGDTIWPHVEEAVVDRVLQARSTIVFANSRGVAERLTARLNEVYVERVDGARIEPDTRNPAHLMGLSGQSDGAPVHLARAHHGSVSKEQRALIEDDLKSGRLRCVVATSSLELGIDMGAVDLVIQVAAPPSVAAGLQRVGRAGHQVGELSRGLLFPTNRYDLLASTVTAARMRSGEIERLATPANPLDLLAQHTIAAAALEPLDVEEWFAMVRRSAPFAALGRGAFEATLDLVSGRYPSEEFGELRPRLVWDRDAGLLTARPGAQRLAVTSGGTIPDRGMFTVMLAGDDERGGRKVGELDEEMVYESRVGDVIALGATSWRVQEITHDRVIVTPAYGLPARLPFWRGDAVGRSAELGEAIGGFLRRLDDGQDVAIPDLNGNALSNLRGLTEEQREATGRLPTDRTLIIERFRDELGDWRVVLLSPYGRSVHAPWALVVGARIQQRYGVDGSVVANDDGIVARVPDADADPPGADLFVLDPAELERTVTEQVSGSALFAARFRECAARALLLPRRTPGARAPLWQQRQRSAQLLDVARDYPTFPILLETAREVLQDVYDLPALTVLTRRIERREIDILEVTTERASPFAQTQLFGYVGEFMYDGDIPLAERRAAALSLDPDLLAELLGRTDLRELLDPEVVADTERELQRLAPDRMARSPEHVADLVRMLGPMTTREVVDRTVPSHREEAPDWLDRLRNDRRLIETSIAGEGRWAAVEDAARLRDGLGAALPLGIAAAHLESAEDPLADLVARYARTRGPFTTDDVAERYGVPAGVVHAALARLAERRRIVAGEFRPAGDGGEWVDADVLKRLRSRSLAAARRQVEPVDATAFARFLPAWQQVGGGKRGPDAVLAVIDQLAGVPIPASAWETLVLPQRVADYQPAMLDELLSSGEASWSGAGRIAGDDGWLRLTPGDVDPVPVATTDEPAAGSPAARLLQGLRGSGAFLFAQLRELIPEVEDATVVEALWDLTWSGLVSNDTFAPVRAMLRGGGAHRTRRTPPRARAHRGLRRPARPVLPPAATGRWFALEPSADSTAAAVVRAELALARHGVLTKGAVTAEQHPGGFAAMYRVLREAEQSGDALRGYFVEGLGGAQFAASGAIDRLRRFARDDVTPDEPEPSDDPAVVLAATDPANPYGAALAWPEPQGGHKPGRKAGAIVVLHDGRLVCYVERGGRTLLTFDPSRLSQAAHGLVAAARRLRLGRFTVQTADGAPVARTPVGDALAEAGFEAHPKGLRLDA